VEKREFDIFRNKVRNLPIDAELHKYFINIIDESEREFHIALKARERKFDPDNKPESIFVWNMSERIEKIIGIKGLSEYIESYSNLSREGLALKLVNMLIDGEFGIYSREKIADLSIRLVMAILTEGMTVAPLDGIKKVVIKRGSYGEYLSIYYAGPIRSAGGTEAGLSIIFADYIRKKLGLLRYIPTEQEMYRYLEELRLYERYVGSFQYKISDEDFLYAVKRLPIEVTGVPTDNIEVVVYRDLPRIETNRLRGGALRVLNDGLIGKAKKIYAVINNLNIEGWEWLSYYIKKSHLNKASLSSKYEDRVLKNLVMGRPVFSLSNRPSSFRIRYGREANMGISAVGIHPSVFPILDYFLVIGSQLKINLPGKAAIVVPCDICDPPIVELKDGSVIELSDPDYAEAIKDKIIKILWLGDILISYGDFLENNQNLVPSPYVNEWWVQDLIFSYNNLKINNQSVTKLVNKVLSNNFLSYKEAKILSKKLRIPMYPKYTPHWGRINREMLINLIYYLKDHTIDPSPHRYILKKNNFIMNLLKLLLIPYHVVSDKIVISENFSPLFNDLYTNIPLLNFINFNMYEDIYDILKLYLGIEFKDVEGYKISARLGRPEKVKPRKMTPSVHVLFPIESHGGPQRDIIKAMKDEGVISIKMGIRRCSKCGTYTYRVFCEYCGERTKKLYYCNKCKRIVEDPICPHCGVRASHVKNWTIDLNDLIYDISRKYNVNIPKKIKGVKGLLNKDGIPEDIVKGMIRAKYGITIFKDGTSRVDATNAPLHKFRPKDIELSAELAQKLGYNINSIEDVIDLYPQDIIIPKKAAEYLYQVSKYIDELLLKVYNLKPFYNLSSYRDLIGKLVVGLSPHTSVGIVGRIIGFTDSQVLYASPIWHAAKRRDCDGDQDSIMLLLDVLINFSVHYLPQSSGGKMDAPLYINIVIHPDEVDTQVHNMDIVDRYPREFYISTLSYVSPRDVKKYIKTLGDALGSTDSYYKFKSFMYYNSLSLKRNINNYSIMKSMRKKLDNQLKIIDLIFDEHTKKTIVSNLINNHILRDISGNLRSFSMQSFRCPRCNKIHRRPPLNGRCDNCGAELVQTVPIKNVTKYLDFAKNLVSLSEDRYLQDIVDLVSKEIEYTFKAVSEMPYTLDDLLIDYTEEEEE